MNTGRLLSSGCATWRICCIGNKEFATRNCGMKRLWNRTEEMRKQRLRFIQPLTLVSFAICGSSKFG